ncbi:MAG: hypothetical protein IJY04_03630 [Clostridia bacterium]|nr:hypothetical protein [Clostridia bacterium]
MSKQNNSTYYDLFGGNDKEQKPKGSPWLLVIAIALALTVVILLAVFLSSYLGVVHLRSEDGGITLTDKFNGITYELAPMCYEPVAYIPEEDNGIYAKYGKTEYYMVRDASPEKYLCTIDMGIYDLYYASGIKLPTLEEFAPNYTRVAKVEAIAIQVGSIDKENTENIVRYFLTSETVDSALISGVETTLYLKFMSEEYKFLYYNLVYYETKGGDRYLYDRTTGRCVDLGDEFKEVI